MWDILIFQKIVLYSKFHAKNNNWTRIYVADTCCFKFENFSLFVFPVGFFVGFPGIRCLFSGGCFDDFRAY